ncbi:MAG: hypothetical protein ACRCZ9_06205 [Fusobacteriaceae bacterium]
MYKYEIKRLGFDIEVELHQEFKKVVKKHKKMSMTKYLSILIKAETERLNQEDKVRTNA